MPEGRGDRPPVGPLERPNRSHAGALRRQHRRRVAILSVIAVVAIGSLGAVVVFGSGYVRGFEDKDPPAPVSTAEDSKPATSAAEAVVASTAPSAEATRLIEIGWVGDLTPGSKYGNPPQDGRALFTYTRDYLSDPDIMVANLEGTFGTGGPSKCDGRDSSVCYAFQAPPVNAESLAWAGIDVVNLANNHSRDYLDQGLISTREALEANGLAHTGLVDTVAFQEVDGVRVAFLGFSPYPWSPNIGDLTEAQKLVRAAGEAADIVVVLMHAGAEGADKTRTPKGAESAYGEFRGDSRAFSHAVIDAGADLVLGSGPHVVRGMEEYKGRLIAYSLGNFAGWKNFSRAGALALSGLLTVQLDEDGRVVNGRWHSLKIVDPGVPKPDSDHTSAKLVGKLSEQDFTTPVQLEEDGSFTFE